MKIENEYVYQPTTEEAVVGMRVQKSVVPTPTIEFVAQPAYYPGMSWVNREIRVTNPDTGATDDFDVDLTVLRPDVTVADMVARLGFTLAPAPAPFKAPMTPAPSSGFGPAPGPNFVLTPFGWGGK